MHVQYTADPCWLHLTIRQVSRNTAYYSHSLTVMFWTCNCLAGLGTKTLLPNVAQHVSYDFRSTAMCNCLQVFPASWNGDQQPERAGEGQGQGG